MYDLHDAKSEKCYVQELVGLYRTQFRGQSERKRSRMNRNIKFPPAVKVINSFLRSFSLLLASLCWELLGNCWPCLSCEKVEKSLLMRDTSRSALPAPVNVKQVLPRKQPVISYIKWCHRFPHFKRRKGNVFVFAVTDGDRRMDGAAFIHATYCVGLQLKPEANNSVASQASCSSCKQGIHLLRYPLTQKRAILGEDIMSCNCPPVKLMNNKWGFSQKESNCTGSNSDAVAAWLGKLERSCVGSIKMYLQLKRWESWMHLFTSHTGQDIPPLLRLMWLIALVRRVCCLCSVFSDT